jgi:hypothetical protein
LRWKPRNSKLRRRKRRSSSKGTPQGAETSGFSLEMGKAYLRLAAGSSHLRVCLQLPLAKLLLLLVLAAALVMPKPKPLASARFLMALKH